MAANSSVTPPRTAPTWSMARARHREGRPISSTTDRRSGAELPIEFGLPGPPLRPCQQDQCRRRACSATIRRPSRMSFLRKRFGHVAPCVEAATICFDTACSRSNNDLGRDRFPIASTSPADASDPRHQDRVRGESHTEAVEIELLDLIAATAGMKAPTISWAICPVQGGDPSVPGRPWQTGARLPASSFHSALNALVSAPRGASTQCTVTKSSLRPGLSLDAASYDPGSSTSMRSICSKLPCYLTATPPKTKIQMTHPFMNTCNNDLPCQRSRPRRRKDHAVERLLWQCDLVFLSRHDDQHPDVHSVAIVAPSDVLMSRLRVLVIETIDDESISSIRST